MYESHLFLAAKRTITESLTLIKKRCDFLKAETEFVSVIFCKLDEVNYFFKFTLSFQPH
jgi:hypothetical protein